MAIAEALPLGSEDEIMERRARWRGICAAAGRQVVNRADGLVTNSLVVNRSSASAAMSSDLFLRLQSWQHELEFAIVAGPRTEEFLGQFIPTTIDLQR